MVDRIMCLLRNLIGLKIWLVVVQLFQGDGFSFGFDFMINYIDVLSLDSLFTIISSCDAVHDVSPCMRNEIDVSA